MKVIMLNPINKVLNYCDIEQLGNVQMEVYSEIKPFEKITSLSSKESKILILDPDFVEWNFDKNMIDQIVNLKAVIITSTAYDWVDVDHLKSKGIIFSNLSNFSSGLGYKGNFPQ